MPLPTTITVTGTFLDGDGAPEKGYVEFSSSVGVVSTGSNVIVSPVYRRATLDSAGSISVALFATDDPDWLPQGWTWQVTHQFRGGGARTYSIELPYDSAGATVDLADLVPVQASSGSVVSGGGVLSVNGDGGPYVVLTAAAIGAATAAHDHNLLYSGTSTLTRPLVDVVFSDVPASSDSDILKVTQVSGGTPYVTGWLNERGYVRAQQRPGSLFDHLVSLIAHPSGTGNLVNLEVTDGGGARSNAGGFDKLARNITSLQGWQPLTTFDPAVTGHYAAYVDANVDVPAGRWDTDDVVRLRGRVAVTTTTTNGEVICSVAAEFAPSKRRLLATALANGALCPVEVFTDGTIVCRRTSAGSTQLSFDDITYHR